jgi:hypothetical protein
LNRPTFTTAQHPWKTRIPSEQIHDMFCFAVPTEIFRSNAKGWQHVRRDRIDAAAAYLAGMEFLGNMIKYAKDIGTAGVTGCEYTYTRKDPRRPEAMVTTPKVIFLLTLVVRQVMKSAGGGTAALPEHRMFAHDNQLSILVTVMSLDPELKLIDLVRLLVRENAGALPDDVRPFAQDDAVRKIDGYERFANRMAVRSGDGSGDEGDDPEEGEGDSQGEGGAGGSQSARGKGKKKGPAYRPKRRDPKHVPTMSDLHRQMYTLKKALAVLTDTQFGKRGSRDLIANRALYGTRAALDSSIDSERDPDVVLRTALSLSNVLKNVVAGLDGMASANQQLNPAAYVWNAPAEDGGDEFFCVPYPDLTWEFDASQVTPEQLTSSEFPWYVSSVLRTYASVVASRYGIAIDDAIDGILSQRLSDEVMAAVVDRDAAGQSPSARRSSQLHDAEVYRMLGIAAPPLKRGCSDASSADDGDSTSDVVEMRSEIREVGEITQSAVKFVDLIAAEQLAAAGASGCAPRVSVDDDGDDEAAAGDSRSPDRMRCDEDDDEGCGRKRSRSDERKTTAEGVRADRRDAIGEIREVAAKEFGGLIDPGARIPKSLKVCAKMIRLGCSFDLPFTIHSTDMGVFSNVVTEIVLLFKYMGIATNNVPLLMLMLARDSVFMSGVTGTLAAHPLISGAYASGKSFIWEALEKCSLKWHVEYIMGSSPKGILPVYGNADECPPDGVLIAFDELPPIITDANARLSTSESEVQGALASVMTSSRRGIRYRTNMKNGDGRIVTHTMLIIANIGVAGASNKPLGNNAPCARMMPVHLTPASVGTTRNAVNFMCSQHGGDISEGVVSDSLCRLDALCSLASNAMYMRALPAPNDELLLTHMSVAIEFLQRTRPDIVKQIRSFETSRTLASVAATWTAAACRHSVQFGEARGKPFAASDIVAIAPYNNISYEIAFFVIAMVIHNATNPVSHRILRWLVEGIGRYPFVSSLKAKSRIVARGSRFATTARAAGEPRPQPADAEELAEIEARVLDPASELSLAEGVAQFGDLIFDNYPPATLVISKDPIEASLKKSRQQRPAAAARRGRSAAQRAQQSESSGLVAPQTADELVEMWDGPSFQYPMGESVGTCAKRGIAQLAREIQEGSKDPDRVYMYKHEPAPDGGVYANPNYVHCGGSPDRLASLFVQKHPSSKLSLENVMAEMANLFEGRLMRAHLLPLIRAGGGVDRKVLNNAFAMIETYRADLWDDPRCVVESVPIVVPSQTGIYILVEAVLDSPKNLVRRVLDYLCCSGTPTCKMAMPFSRGSDAAHLLCVYDAVTVPERTLRCSNPVHTHASEAPMLAAPISSALSLRRFKEPEITWDGESELRSIRAHFEENGIRADPAAYTARGIHSRIVMRVGTAAQGSIDAVAKGVVDFDKDARARQVQCDANFARSKAKSSSSDGRTSEKDREEDDQRHSVRRRKVTSRAHRQPQAAAPSRAGTSRQPTVIVS